jgi:hypothetical protein
MLTALGSEADVVCGLDAIRPRELLARVRSLGRRIGAVGTTRDLAFDPLRVSPSARQVKVHETTVRLTATEWHLLFGLVSEPDPQVASSSGAMMPRARRGAMTLSRIERCARSRYAPDSIHASASPSRAIRFVRLRMCSHCSRTAPMARSAWAARCARSAWE